MSTHKWIDRICIIVLILAVILTVLFMHGSKLGLTLLIDPDTEKHSDDTLFTENDLAADWDTSDAVEITLKNGSAAVDAENAYMLDGDLVIAASGKYVLRGSMPEGSIVVNANENSKVWILLDGLDINCSDDACFRVDQADKVFLTLAEGSENTMKSGSDYSKEALADKTDGTIFAHDDLTINGSGSLTVNAGYKFGIAANDDLVITGGNISVEAPDSAIHTNDSFRATGAAIEIESDRDGIHAGGDISIADGDITINVGDDGIHSDTAIDLLGGTILIETCYEGIEAPQITMNDGDITIYPEDDGLNASDGSEGGGFAPPDFGNGPPDFENGPPDFENGPPDFENGPPERPAADGTEAENDSLAKEDSSAEESTLPCVTINGGTLTIINENAQDADGIDSNGNIIINGGTVKISIEADHPNTALDFGSKTGSFCRINGGIVIACGSRAMAEDVDESSAQNVIQYSPESTLAAGTTLRLADSEGTVLLEWTVPCSFSHCVLSTPLLASGDTYTISAGDTSQEATLDSNPCKVGSTFDKFSDRPDNRPPEGAKGQRPPEGAMGQEPPEGAPE